MARTICTASSSRDQRSQVDPRRRRAERAQDRVRLEHRLLGTAERRQLVEVVHHPDRVEPGLLRGARELDDAAEQLGVGRVEGEVRDLQAESRHDRPPVGAGA
jgi:hypothetical protein